MGISFPSSALSFDFLRRLDFDRVRHTDHENRNNYGYHNADSDNDPKAPPMPLEGNAYVHAPQARNHGWHGENERDDG